jgi:hypothetical protein
VLDELRLLNVSERAPARFDPPAFDSPLVVVASVHLVLRG